MKITTIRYRRLQSHDRGYGHDAVEAEAQIDEGEDADAALDTLKAWVLHRLEGVREVDRHIDSLQRLQGDVKSAERRLAGLHDDIKQGREIIGQHEKLAEIAKREGLDAEGDQLFAVGLPF